MEKATLEILVLALVGDPELADRWWYSPNRAFDMQRPIDADIKDIRDYLMFHCFNAGGGS